MAIILDDVAGDPGAVDAIFSLHYPLTLSVLPNHPRSTEIAEDAHRRGYQVMLHLPMESLANETPEIQELRPGMSSAEVSNVLNSMLRSVPYAAGVNNHQGS
ncbi:MAG: divergent polysaccharide deacetylase family protein, partial [Candidatus Acidiferrum sp.]